MTDKQIEIAIRDLFQNQKDITKHLTAFQKLNVMLQKAESLAFEKNIHQLITTFLKTQNATLQISAMNILITCFKRGLFRTTKDLDVAYLVIDIALNTVTDNVEHQELWLKAFSTLEVMDSLHEEFYKTRTLEMMKIMEKVVGSASSSIQKLSALKMLNKLVMTIDLNIDLQNTFHVFWIEQICPLMFNLEQPNLQSSALEISKSSLVLLQNCFLKEDDRFGNFSEKVKNKYSNVMKTLVLNENLLFAKLWIYLVELLGARLQGIGVVNELLSVLELGFKSPSMEIRIHSFYCWQQLLEIFFFNPVSFFTDKRVNLLILPLKANNGKSEELVEIKFKTWFKVFNGLVTKTVHINSELIEQYLQFCFGPLCEQPLISWFSHHAHQVSQGKKFPGIHLMACKAFLQLFGVQNYIDEELNSKLKYFSFDCPKISLSDYSSSAKLIVNSVGECCVMLSQLENSDRFECAAINEALWKSLFYSVDIAEEENLKKKYTEDISAMILALVAVARKRPSLITFGLVPLFNILTSNEFKIFNNERVTNLLFIPMIQTVLKKDKVLLQYDVVLIFKKIFLFQRHQKDFLKFVQTILERNFVANKDSIIPEKISMLHNIWFLLEEELKNYLQDVSNCKIDEKLYIAAFSEFFVWPIPILDTNFSQEKISTKWKELYELIGKYTSASLQNKLAVNILKNLNQIFARPPYFLSVAEITNYLIINLKLSESEDTSDVVQVFSLLKSFLLMENMDNESLAIFQRCARRLFSSSKNLIHFPFCLLDPVLDCLHCLLTAHKYLDILEDVDIFVQTFQYNIKYKSSIEKLMTTLKNSGIETDIIGKILENCSTLISGSTKSNALSSRNKCVSDTEINHRKAGRKSLFKSKESPEKSSSIKPKIDLNKLVDQAEKHQIKTLLGHDIDTMTPVKLRGRMSKTPVSYPPSSKKQKTAEKEEILVVNTPYKFDPKKLTKHQREKLSRRNSIPAMYEDLSQSQTRDYTSNSSILETKTEDSPTKEQSNPKKSSTPFLDLIASLKQADKQTTQPKTKPENESIKNPEQPKTRGAKKAPKKKTELNSIENKEKGEKSGRRKRIVNSELPSSEPDPLNTAKLDISSADLASGDRENVPVKRKRGRPKQEETQTQNSQSETEVYDSVKIWRNLQMNSSVKRKRGRPKLEETQTIDTQSESEVYEYNHRPPVKIWRNRRKSTGTIKTPEENPPDENDIELDPVKKNRLNRELNRIKMDIKHSEEYTKNDKRKTRMSGSFQVLEEPGEVEEPIKLSVSSEDSSKISQESTLVESEQIIENSQEPEISIKPFKIPVLYPLEEVKPGEQISIDSGTTKTDVVKGPKPTSPFKIIETSSNLPHSSSVCKQIIFPPPQNISPKKKINIISDILIVRTPQKENCTTQSISSEVIAELNDETPATPENPEAPKNPEAPENGLDCRKVLFDTSLTENSEKSENSGNPEILCSPPRQQKPDIVTSPVNTDTPTRTKELLKNTTDISPIKTLLFEEEISFSNMEKVDSIPVEETRTSSPEASSSGVNLYPIPERIRNNSPHPLRMYTRKKNPLKHAGGRSAQMMDLISAKVLNSSNKPKKIKEAKEPKTTDSFFSAPQNRTMKMMGQFEKNDHQEQCESKETEPIKIIRDEDIFTFCKELPSPYASPSASILKKRKASEDSDEAAIRSCKRRRVNFSDPPISCCKYIETNTKKRPEGNPQEPRLTRSTKSVTSEDVAENTDSLTVLLKENPVVENGNTVSILFHTETTESSATPEILPTENAENAADNSGENITDESKAKDSNSDVESPQKQNGDFQKSCEVSVITKNNENSVKNSESLFSEDMPSTSRSTSESVVKWSPPKVKDSILDEEILGGTIQNVVGAIVKIVNEKKLDAQPLVRVLLGESSTFSNSLISKDILSLIAKKIDCIEILKLFDAQKVCQSLLQLATKSEFSELNFKRNLCEIYTSIIENPDDFISCLPKLKIVEIGGVVIRRMDTIDDTADFLKQIYDSVPCDQYLKPVPKELLAKDDTKVEETDEHIAQSFISRVQRGSMPDNLINSALISILEKINCFNMLEFCCEIARRRERENNNA